MVVISVFHSQGDLAAKFGTDHCFLVGVHDFYTHGLVVRRTGQELYACPWAQAAAAEIPENIGFFVGDPDDSAVFANFQSAQRSLFDVG